MNNDIIREMLIKSETMTPDDKIQDMKINQNNNSLFACLNRADLETVGIDTKSANKPVLLKENIIEKNLTHKDIYPQDYQSSLGAVLYKPTEILKASDNKIGYYNLIHKMSDVKYAIATLDFESNKDAIEIVSFHYLSKEGYQRKLKRNEKLKGLKPIRS